MDVLTDVLQTLTPSGGGFGRRNTPPKWAVAVPASDLSVVHIVMRGRCWLALDDGTAPVMLRTGHLAMLPHGHAHKIGADPMALSSAPLRERQCSLTNVETGQTSGTTMACGLFNLKDRGNHPLLAMLPPLMHIKKGDTGQWLGATVRMIAKNADGPGGDALLSQLAGLLFIQIVRAYAESRPAPAIGWLAVMRDPSLRPVLEAIHSEPAKKWSVALLAKHAAMSRTAFAARFKITMGEPPMAYVTRWRMQVAAHLLRTEGPGLLALSEAVGYRSEATFAKTFKRIMGLPPAAYRRGASRAASVQTDAMCLALLG